MLIPKQLSILFRIIFFSKRIYMVCISATFCIWKHENEKSGKSDCLALTKTLAHHSNSVRGRNWIQQSTYLNTPISTFHLRGSRLTIIVKLEFIWF